jgi:hypothetical protein
MGDMEFNGTPEEWDALVKKNKEQETLEEAAENFVNSTRLRNYKVLFIEGAKWQQQQMEKLKDFDTWKEWVNEK